MKSKNKASKKYLLSDKISDALTVKPKADIEDDNIFNTKPKTVLRADLGSSESEDEDIISDFRKRNVDLLSQLSKKYEGKVVSRKELEEDSDLSDEEVMSEDPEKKKGISITNGVSLKKENSLLSGSDSLDPSEETGESDDYSIQQTHNSNISASDASDDNSDDNDNDKKDYDISQMDEPVIETFEHIKKQNVSEEIKKGNCVRNQLLLWEGLLEIRIHLQRCLNTANQMPMPNYYEKLKKYEDFKLECNKTRSNISSLLDRLMALQSILLKSFPDTKKLSTSKITKENDNKHAHERDEEIPSEFEDEEIPSDTDDEENKMKQSLTESIADNLKPNKKKRKLEDYGKEIQQTHKAFKTFRDTTIQKWNEKTRLATAANLKNAPTNTILQQISYILSDRNKLVRRTQLKRSEYGIIGYKKVPEDTDEMDSAKKSRKDGDEYIEEIFDDSDFYHQLLRELIECKSADISDPVQLSRQWIALQQMRSKMKRKVDTKATKGRKIKYVVHNQLVNFMAPEKNINWTDESKNELYNSLFGKMFEHSNVGFKKLSV